jgi:histidine ammonia-lyase
MALVVSRDPRGDQEADSGKAYYQGSLLSGFQAMREAGVERIVLGPKEGLSIVNGTHVTTSISALALWDAKTIVQSADIIGAMSLEALRGISTAYDRRIHELRPHPGQLACAENMRRVFSGSVLIDSLKDVVQDPYAFRCTPQVHGGCRDAIRYVEGVIATEMQSVTDSPLVFVEDGQVQLMSGGNFHAEPLGYATDTLGLVMTGLGTLCERRAYRLLDRALNRGLPSFLVAKPGVNTGLMIAQYTAASLASENKVLSHPSTIDSITASENQEDHVSMATTAARKAGWIIQNVARICGIELLFAAQALDFRCREAGGLEALGVGTRSAFTAFRRVVPFIEADQTLSDCIELATQFIMSRELISAVESSLGDQLL